MALFGQRGRGLNSAQEIETQVWQGQRGWQCWVSAAVTSTPPGRLSPPDVILNTALSYLHH